MEQRDLLALDLFDLVILAEVGDLVGAPGEHLRRPLSEIAVRLAVVLLIERRRGNRREDNAPLGVGLVLALGLGIEEHPLIGVGDRLERNPLVIVVGIALVLVTSPQTPRAHAAADCLFKGIVGRFLPAILEIGAVQPIECVGRVLVAILVIGAEIDADAVVAIVGEDADDFLVGLVDLHLGRVLELGAPVVIPLGAADRVELAIVEAFAPFRLLNRPYRVHALEGAFVDGFEALTHRRRPYRRRTRRSLAASNKPISS
jgi:hypothetical protein